MEKARGDHTRRLTDPRIVLGASWLGHPPGAAPPQAIFAKISPSR